MDATTEDSLARPHASIAPPPLDVGGHALFLDLDGTLVEIAERPDAVAADPALRASLRRAFDLMGGAMAIITGRTIVDAERVIDGALGRISGLHGLERQMARGDLTRPAGRDETIAEVVRELRELERSGALKAMLEDKELSVALHYRQAPEHEAHVRALAEEIAGRHGLRLLQGKMVFELLRTARNKGDALADFMRETPFAGRVPVAVGDDVTDEDAFLKARALGGFAVLVGEPRETAADYRLSDVTAVRAWLEAGVAQGERR